MIKKYIVYCISDVSVLWMGCMGAMMVWVDGCMDGVDGCVDGWDEGLEGMRVWRAILLQWGAEFSMAPPWPS